MAEEKKDNIVKAEHTERTENTKSTENTEREFQLSETWAEDNMMELEAWIEEQGIYIRQ